MKFKKKHMFFVIIFCLVATSLTYLVLKFGPHSTSHTSDEQEQNLSSKKQAQTTKGAKKEEAHSKNKKHDSLEPIVSVFENIKLSESELESFYQRRYEPREITLKISGLKINKRHFQIERVQELPEKLSIPLPDGGIKEFTRKYIDFKDKNNFVWVGSTVDDELETIHLSAYNLSFVGSIETRQATYEIKHLSKEKNIIRKINQSKYPENPNDGVIDPDIMAKKNNKKVDTPTFSKASDTSGSVTGRADAPIVIDIVVGYSHLIKAAEGGADAAIALITLFVAAANITHRNSDTGVALNLRAMMELNVKALSSQEDDLDQLYDVNLEDSNSTSPYYTLMNQRSQTNSDLAALFTEKYTDSCGIAYLLSKRHSSSGFRGRGVSVSAANCLTYVFSHEIGHNLGCQHNREDAKNPNYTLPYAFGFRSTAKGFRTTMSYACTGWDCPKRIFYFSSPDKTVDGISIGQDDQIDNVRSIRERASIISNINESTEARDLSPPQITQQPQGGSIPDGDSLQLSVTATGNNLTYLWYRDDLLLKTQKQPTMTLESSLTSLTGLHVYHVIVLNPNGLIKSNDIEVYFLRKPRLINDLNDLILSLNDWAQFSFSVQAYPEPTVVWLKNDKTIDLSQLPSFSPSTSVPIELEPNYSYPELPLGPAQWFHRGVYSATLTNSQGSTQTKKVRLGLTSEDKWDEYLSDRNPASSIEFGKIDRDLGIKSQGGL